jgi:alpha-beta hydrolase superfamily lysophospholipase
VNEQEMKAIFGATVSKNKKLSVYEGAYHESMLRREPARWRNEVKTFLTEKRK